MNEKFPISLLVVIQYTIHRHKYRQIIIFFLYKQQKAQFCQKNWAPIEEHKKQQICPSSSSPRSLHPTTSWAFPHCYGWYKEGRRRCEWDRKVIECEVRGEGKVGYNDKYPSREREKEVVLLGSSSVSFLPFLYMHAKSYVVVFGKGVLLMWVQAPTDRVWAIV